MANFPLISSGSMKVQGALSSEAMAMYPANVGYAYGTKVHQFLDDTEQRWTEHDSLAYFVLEYTSVNGYDFSVLKAFFISQKGMYVNINLTNTFTIQILGNTYQYCTFDQDSLSEVVGAGDTFAFTLKIKQVRRG